MKVELICFLYDKKLADLDIKTDIPVKVMIDTNQIESVRQMIKGDDYEIHKERSMVTLKSNDSFEIGKSYEEMNKIWNGKRNSL
ncbi:MAG: hypothetical protein ACUZ8H_16015 [Candidatus Anammoxibacter sp.]